MQAELQSLIALMHSKCSSCSAALCSVPALFADLCSEQLLSVVRFVGLCADESFGSLTFALPMRRQ